MFKHSSPPDQGSRKVLSAGCGLGAELISFAAMAERAGLKDMSYEGVDISGDFLLFASNRIYPEEMFRGTPSWFKKFFYRCLDEYGNEWRQLQPHRIDNLRFHPATNIADFRSEYKYDIAFLMNVLCHMTAEMKKKIIENIAMHCSGIICLSRLDMIRTEDTGALEEECDTNESYVIRAAQTMEMVCEILGDNDFMFAKSEGLKNGVFERDNRSYDQKVASASGVLVAVHKDFIKPAPAS